MIQIEWDIIERKLGGELTPEEEIRFNAWCAERKENLDYFRRVESFYQESGFVKEITEEQASVSWNKFHARLPEIVDLPKVKKRKSRTMLYAWSVSGVAACLLIGLMITWKWQPEGTAESTGAILGGGNKAVLTLSTGEQIELENGLSELEDVTAKISNTGSALSYEEKTDTVLTETIYNEIKTPKGGEYCVTLADGTKVFLGALSSIRFPVTFTGKKRVVEVTGEAYFDVMCDPKHPFIVEMENMKVEVLGTSFNVRDYADEMYVEATLVSGKVKVYTGLDSCILEPSHQAVLDKMAHTLSEREVDVSEFVDWKQGKLNIRNQRLEDILIRLSKWYDIEVFYVNQEAKDARFYASIDRYGDLNELLDKFEKTNEVKFEIKGNIVKVMAVK